MGHQQVKYYPESLLLSPESANDVVPIDKAVEWGGRGWLLIAGLGCGLLLETGRLQCCWENVFDSQIFVVWGSNLKAEKLN